MSMADKILRDLSDMCMRREADPYYDIYPLTIIADRYTGVYSGGEYLAFNLEFIEIPSEVIGNDVECRNFFDNNTNLVYGRGNTPDEAIKDLAKQMKGDTYED